MNLTLQSIVDIAHSHGFEDFSVSPGLSPWFHVIGRWRFVGRYNAKKAFEKCSALLWDVCFEHRAHVRAPPQVSISREFSTNAEIGMAFVRFTVCDERGDWIFGNVDDEQVVTGFRLATTATEWWKRSGIHCLTVGCEQRTPYVVCSQCTSKAIYEASTTRARG